MMPDERGDGARKRQPFEKIGADFGVPLDLLVFLRRQRRTLREQVVGNRKLADVMKEGRDFDRAQQPVFHKSEPQCQGRGVPPHSSGVLKRGHIPRC